jgi:glyoxylase I family protein
MIRLRNIDHVVLRVRDLEAMTRFYRDVLGAQVIAHRPELAMTHLRAGTSIIDLVQKQEDAGAGRNMDHFCLRVEPFDEHAIVAHLARHGVAVGEVRRRFGAEGTGTSIYLADPEGNTVELKGPSDGALAPRP